MASTNTVSFIAVSILLVSFALVPTGSAITHIGPMSDTFSSPPAPSTPYVTTFKISCNSSDYTPFLISPSSQTSAWAVMVQTRNGKPPIAQILNFTVGQTGCDSNYVLSQPMINIPSDIVYNRTATTLRVWILENDSLAYYRPGSQNLTIAHTFLNDSPQYMALDKQGNVWLTLLTSNRIAEFDPATNATKFYNAPSTSSALQGIAVAPDGSIWFAETIAKRLGHLIPCNTPPCSITDYGPPVSVPVNFPIQVAVDHNGTVWFTDHGSNQFGNYNPSTNQWNTFPIGYCSEAYNPQCAVGLPNAISVDSNGLVWFSEHFAGRIAKYDQKTGLLTEYVVPASQTPYTWWMQPGPGNRVWFTAFGIGELGYVNTTVEVPFALSTTSSLQIARGTSETLTATILNPNTTVSVNFSLSSYDAPYGGPYLLYGSTNGNQIAPSQSFNTATFTITASWNLPAGQRNLAITEYNGVVNVNAYVRVNVVENPAEYETPGAAVAVGIGSIVLFWTNIGRRRKDATESENDSGATLAQSQ